MGQGSRSHPVPSRSMDKLPHLRQAFCPPPHTTDPRPHQIPHTFSGKLLASVPSHIFHHTSCLNRTPRFPSPSPSLAPSLQLPFALSPCSGLAPSPFLSPLFPRGSNPLWDVYTAPESETLQTMRPLGSHIPGK